MFPSSSNLHDSGNSATMTPHSSTSSSSMPQEQQLHPQKQENVTQKGPMIQDCTLTFGEKMYPELWEWPSSLRFMEDPFFTAVLPFGSVDSFLRDGPTLDTMSKCMADQQRQLLRWHPFWFSDSGNTAWPPFLSSDFFEPDIFASDPSPFFRKPWWRPSFWAQQRQLHQKQQQLVQQEPQTSAQPQQQQQQQQQEQHEDGLRQQWRQHEQQTLGDHWRNLISTNKGATESTASSAPEDEIPVILTKSKCYSSGATPNKGIAATNTSRNLRNFAMNSAAATEENEEHEKEREMHLRRLRWFTDPFFSDPLSYVPLSLKSSLNDNGAATSTPATCSSAVTAAPRVNAAASDPVSETFKSTPPLTTRFVPFVAPSSPAAAGSHATVTCCRPAAATTSFFSNAATTTHGSTTSAENGACTVSLPRVDIRDCGDVLLVEAEVPGYHKENLHVSIEGKGLLRISGQQAPPQQQNLSRQHQQLHSKKDVLACNNAGSFYLQERSRSSSFSRDIPLPVNVKENDVRASVSDGVLHVRIPKEEMSPLKSSRVIDIE